jgi:hypothetical protein
VLVSITSEAIVDVPDDAQNVDEFLREQVSLVWGEALVERLVHEDVSVAYYAVEEPVAEPPAAEEEPVAASIDADVAATTDEVDRAVMLAEASIVDEQTEPHPVAESEIDESVVEEVTVLDEDVVEEVAVVDEGVVVGETPIGEDSSASFVQPVSAFDAPAPSSPRELTDDEVLSLFTDPLYKDMIRSAVRDRATAMLELVVAEVVSELEPLIRRQSERRRPSGT